MTELLKDWILNMTIMAIGCAIAMSLTPESRVKSVLRMGCTLAMTIALLSPIGSIDMDGYAKSLASYRESIASAEQRGAESADRMVRTVIESECAAYISDKGSELGLGAIDVRVLAKWGDAFWYPYEIWLATAENEELTRYIEGELGVPRERMHWSNGAAQAG